MLYDVLSFAIAAKFGPLTFGHLLEGPAIERRVRLLQPVDRDVAAIDPMGSRRGQKDDDVGHLLGRAEPAVIRKNHGHDTCSEPMCQFYGCLGGISPG
jgi:hypothetical protein